MRAYKKYPSQNKGAVLIFALWVLSFLAVMALNLGVSIRQKMTFAKRIESRSQINHIAEGGVKVAVALLFDDLQKNDFQYTPAAKSFRHNNPVRFQDIRVGEGVCEVGYWAVTDGGNLEKRFGIVDEESKININTADKIVLRRIVAYALALDEDNAAKIADAIFDWRQRGDSELKGFFSDDYYSNLQFPDAKKSEPFELPDELMLLKGIDRAAFDVLLSYLTVYGDGHVNVNTASKAVLMAIGLPEEVADKLLQVRRGQDAMDNTLDDHVFYRTYDIASEVGQSVKLEQDEVRAIDQLNARGLIAVNSYFFMVRSESFSTITNDRKNITCVVSARENRIVYWKEK